MRAYDHPGRSAAAFGDDIAHRLVLPGGLLNFDLPSLRFGFSADPIHYAVVRPAADHARPHFDLRFDMAHGIGSIERAGRRGGRWRGDWSRGGGAGSKRGGRRGIRSRQNAGNKDGHDGQRKHDHHEN